MALLLTWEVNMESKNPTIKLILENLLKIAVMETDILFLTESSTFHFTSIYNSMLSISSTDISAWSSITSPGPVGQICSVIKCNSKTRSHMGWRYLQGINY